MPKLKFDYDVSVNGVPTYKKGVVYDFDNKLGAVDRWLKRGAILVKEGEESVVEEQKQAPVKEDLDDSLETFDQVDSEIEALGSDVEVAKEEVKKETKKANKKTSGK